MKRIIAGYTAAPAGGADAADYYGALVQIPEADGLEFAWNGPQTPAQLDDLLPLVPAHWVITLNDIPATFRAGVNHPAFGLASTDEAGRSAAMGMLRDMHDTIRKINDRAGRRMVLAAEIHSAPGFDQREYTADADALKRSLDEATALEWEGCAVLLEHCDAYIPGQKQAKGFLSLQQEIEVLERIAGSPVGVSINWGRSLVEVRAPGRVMEHVIAASQVGLLRAFTFSGTAGVKNVYGEAWADSHLPFATTTEGVYGEPASLMNPAHVAPVLDYLHDCVFLAIKTNWPAARKDPLERAASVAANFYTLHEELLRDKRFAATKGGGT